MTSTLVTDIAELVTNDSANGDNSLLGIMRDAALVIEDGAVAWIGHSSDAPAADAHVSAAGRAVIPGFVDSHAHLMFSGDRVADFTARMTGMPYSAGGIRTTVAATRAASDEDLRANLHRLVHDMRRGGITTMEIKSGYGLSIADEERCLRIASEVTSETTFLGAHVVPAEFSDNRAAYIDLVIGSMLAACAPHARWIDVFCDSGAFDVDESRRILNAGVAAGLLPRVHGNQMSPGPGIALAVEIGAASVDHCTYADDDDLALLAASDTVATLLPGAEFSTRSPYPDARRFFEAGVTVALATDCNPGTSYVTSMSWCIAMAVREMRFTPAQALYAATAVGAAALRRSDIGHLTVGARADLVILDAPSHEHIAYRPGTSLIHTVFIGGIPHLRDSMGI
jgi:imidazolonepropionase